MKKYVINNMGESNCRIVRELTDEQYDFLLDIFSELNDSYDGTYAPHIGIYPYTDEEEYNDIVDIEE